jgi:hypothetical protein
MARSENFCGAPGRPVGLAVQALIAAGEIHMVMSPRLTRDWSYSAQFVTRDLVLYFKWTLEFIVKSSARPGRDHEIRPSLPSRAVTICTNATEC